MKARRYNSQEVVEPPKGAIHKGLTVVSRRAGNVCLLSGETHPNNVPHSIQRRQPGGKKECREGLHVRVAIDWRRESRRWRHDRDWTRSGGE
jgi:hypothetical protein